MSRLAEHEVALRAIWRELAEKGIEGGVDYPRIVRTLFVDLDHARDAALEEAARAIEAAPKGLHSPPWLRGRDSAAQIVRDLKVT